MKRHPFFRAGSLTTYLLSAMVVLLGLVEQDARSEPANDVGEKAVEAITDQIRKLDATIANAAELVGQGRRIFRFDTFGDETFWGDMLQLHLAIEGARFGGVGPGLSPKDVLSLGLKVDVNALPRPLLNRLARGQVNLDDPAVTLQLLKLDAVVGLTGFFNSSGTTLNSVGIQCAICHSTVDNSHRALCPATLQPPPNPGTGCIGHRLDGWPNRDLNVGAIAALAPNLQPFVDLLSVVHPGITQAQVRDVLNSWGPGKFDAELLLDGKTSNPNTGMSGATLIPPAFGLGGVNLHTWTGWGSVPHWNAFVANLEMHGVGRFWDPRLNDAAQFPIAAHFRFGDLPHISPDDDRITSKLQALQFYQLAIPAPQPPPGSFDPAAAARGDALFSGKANCNSCHVEPLWTDPGWNLHTPAEICIDSFQADRAPDHRYRTSPIGELFTHVKGGFYHDGRFADLKAVVDHYNTCMSLGLTPPEENDLIEYLKSLTFGPRPSSEDTGRASSKID
jgi:hypothetical protein